MRWILTLILSDRLQPKFIGFRTLFEAREQPSRMYHWSVMVFASLAVEIPYNIFWYVPRSRVFPSTVLLTLMLSQWNHLLLLLVLDRWIP